MYSSINLFVQIESGRYASINQYLKKYDQGDWRRGGGGGEGGGCLSVMYGEQKGEMVMV